MVRDMDTDYPRDRFRILVMFLQNHGNCHIIKPQSFYAIGKERVLRGRR